MKYSDSIYFFSISEIMLSSTSWSWIFHLQQHSWSLSLKETMCICLLRNSVAMWSKNAWSIMKTASQELCMNCSQFLISSNLFRILLPIMWFSQHSKSPRSAYQGFSLHYNALMTCYSHIIKSKKSANLCLSSASKVQ